MSDDALSAGQQNLKKEDDPLLLANQVYQLWWNWADFEMFVITPNIELITPPLLIKPDFLSDGTEEFVYPIHDFGYKLSTSKAEDMFRAGKSMCKLFYTIEKMIFILIERLKSGGISTEEEVQVAFGGHEIAQRKAFESIINLLYNVVVTNFDPGPWGETYLANIKRMANKGLGYPSQAPRQNYRANRGPVTSRTLGKS